jgi:ATPase subunit of ABC transporter with duplicated ATPase domains
MSYKLKICKRCGKEYRSTSNSQKYCEKCRSIIVREYNRQYAKQWRKEYSEYKKQYDRQWRKEHPNYDKEWSRQWTIKNSEKRIHSVRKWEKNHPEKYKEIMKRRSNKRRRSFGFIPLNSYKEGYVFHHLDKVYGVYIPEEIHQNISHSVLRNINMDTINAVAFNYLGR